MHIMSYHELGRIGISIIYAAFAIWSGWLAGAVWTWLEAKFELERNAYLKEQIRKKLYPEDD